MNSFKQSIVNINWGAPNIILAVLAVTILIIFSSKKNRTTPTYLLSALLGGVGFLISGWLGVLTIAMAFSYRFFQKLSSPWQAIITWTAGLSAFAFITWLIQSIDPKAAKERTNGSLSGVFKTISDTTDMVANNRTLLISVFVGGAVLTMFTFWRMRRKAKFPYLGQGVSIDREMMFQGIVNPNLETIPAANRDPQRTFSSKMRKTMLDEQQGICRYQPTVNGHPKWEPYRAGIQWEGDHIVPHAAGGATNQTNLQMLCADCNSAKSSKFGPAAIKAIENMWSEKS